MGIIKNEPMREEKTRVISVRRARKQEVKEYES